MRRSGLMRSRHRNGDALDRSSPMIRAARETSRAIAARTFGSVRRLHHAFGSCARSCSRSVLWSSLSAVADPVARGRRRCTSSLRGLPVDSRRRCVRGPEDADAADARASGRSRALASAGSVDAALVTSGIDRFGDGDTIVRYAQTHRGLPVIGRGASVRSSARAASR